MGGFHVPDSADLEALAEISELTELAMQERIAAEGRAPMVASASYHMLRQITEVKSNGSTVSRRFSFLAVLLKQ
jgi:hypothetical protein